MTNTNMYTLKYSYLTPAQLVAHLREASEGTGIPIGNIQLMFATYMSQEEDFEDEIINMVENMKLSHPFNSLHLDERTLNKVLRDALRYMASVDVDDFPKESKSSASNNKATVKEEFDKVTNEFEEVVKGVIGGNINDVIRKSLLQGKSSTEAAMETAQKIKDAMDNGKLNPDQIMGMIENGTQLMKALGINVPDKIAKEAKKEADKVKEQEPVERNTRVSTFSIGDKSVEVTSTEIALEDATDEELKAHLASIPEDFRKAVLSNKMFDRFSYEDLKVFLAFQQNVSKKVALANIAENIAKYADVPEDVLKNDKEIRNAITEKALEVFDEEASRVTQLFFLGSQEDL